MGIKIFGDGWFITPSQQKELDEAYFKKMFPFGERQKQWEDNIIKELYSNKNKISAIKYASYIKREMLIDDKYSENNYLNSIEHMGLSSDDLKFVEKFTRLEYKANTYEELPTIEMIKEELING